MPDKGAYQLVLRLIDSKSIKIGALGTYHFPQGFYVYTGSAMNNLSKRVVRHCKKDKKLRWHIDYLTSRVDVKICRILLFRSVDRIECKLNLKALETLGAKPIIPKFGASDCNCCPAHLLYLGKNLTYNYSFEHLKI